MMRVLLLLLAACSGMGNDHEYAHPYTTHEEFWNNAIYRNYARSLPPGFDDTTDNIHCFSGSLHHCN